MKMTVIEFDQRLTQYMRSVLIPECQAPLRKFALGALLGTGKLSVRILPKEFSEALGVFDKDGNVDVEILKLAASGGVDTAGELYVPVIGLHFNKADFEKFFSYIEKGVVG